MTAVPAAALVIGLGGNVGTEAQIVDGFKAARHELGRFGRSVASPVYRTSPQGGPPQQSYLNAALAFEIQPGSHDAAGVPAIEPVELMAFLLEFEARLGRDRSQGPPLSPRPIDLDVLLWGNQNVYWPGPPILEVPHPRLVERRFALAPVIDLLGEDVVIPGHGKSLIACWDALRNHNQWVERTKWDLGA